MRKPWAERALCVTSLSGKSQDTIQALYIVYGAVAEAKLHVAARLSYAYQE